MQTKLWGSSRRLAALLALTSVGYTAPNTIPNTATAALLTITSPKAGASLEGQAVKVEVQIDPTAKRASFAAKLNGIDVTNRFTVARACTATACTESATLVKIDGLIKGQNTIRMRIKGSNGNVFQARVNFSWSLNGPTGGLTETAQIPQPNYNFTTLTPGGYQSTGSPWFQITNAGLHGGVRNYPAQGPLCGGRGFRYTLIQIDRNTLDEVSETCLNTEQVDAALKAVPSTQFAVFGTNSTYNADWQNLNTTPIGGTDFRSKTPSPEVPYGYMVLGIGQAPYGVAMEDFNTGYEVNDSSLAQIQGVFTRNTRSLFEFHPCDFMTYSIDGPNKKVVINGQTFTPPSPLPAIGYWVLPFSRKTLNPLAGNQGVTFDAVDTNAIQSMNTLLSNLTWRQMAFVIGWGKQSTFAYPISMSPLVTTLASMGIPYPTIQQMTTDQSALAALVTPDPTIAIALPNRRVPVSLTPSGNGQKGQLVGSLGRDKYYLFRPTYTAQANLSSPTPIDASFLRTIWQQNLPWPMMDTPGRVSAYKYLSNRILHNVWADKLPTGPTDDIRYVYTLTNQNNLLIGVKPDTDPAYTAYPTGGTYTNPDNKEIYQFTAGEMKDVAAQLRAELNALADVLPFLGTSTTGANLRGRLFQGPNAWVPGWVTSNTITLNQSPYVNQSSTIGFSFDDIVYHAAALTPNPMVQSNPVFGPMEGLMQSLVIAVGYTGVMDVNNNGMPTPGYGVVATIKDFMFNYVTWVGQGDAAYEQILDLATSDWNRLQTLSQAIRTRWSPDNNFSWLDSSNTLKLGANRFFYTNFLRTYYSLDAYWFTNITKSTSVGSLTEECSSESGCTPTCRGVYLDSPTPDSSALFPSVPPSGKNDLYQMSSPISNQAKKTMSVSTPRFDLTTLLFGSDQQSGQFALPKEIWYTMGALPIRSGANTPQYEVGGCVLP